MYMYMYTYIIYIYFLFCCVCIYTYTYTYIYTLCQFTTRCLTTKVMNNHKIVTKSYQILAKQSYIVTSQM